MAKKRKNKRMRKRLWFTATERVEVWDRWQRGESSQSIGRVLDRGASAPFTGSSNTCADLPGVRAPRPG